MIAAFDDEPVQVASLMTQILDPELIYAPNIVKVVVDNAHHALYFSRSPIPFNVITSRT